MKELHSINIIIDMRILVVFVRKTIKQIIHVLGKKFICIYGISNQQTLLVKLLPKILSQICPSILTF